MKKINKETIEETIKELSKGQQKIIMHLAETFQGEEETINEHVKKLGKQK